jgi:hypothetical protein
METFSDVEVEALDTYAFGRAYKPLVKDVRVLGAALENDGYTVVDLTAPPARPASPEWMRRLAHELTMTSPSAVDLREGAELPFHAARVSTMIHAALSSPKDTRAFAATLKKDSRRWSGDMVAAFHLILSFSLLRPTMERTASPKDPAAVAAAVVLKALPKTSNKIVRAELTQWGKWSSRTLEGVLREIKRRPKARKRRAATQAELEPVARLMGRIPPDLVALYAFAANLDHVLADQTLVWLRPADAVGAARATHEVGLPKAFLPLATDQAGNFSCFDSKTGRVMDWDHETRKPTLLAPSLAAYLDREIVSRRGAPKG